MTELPTPPADDSLRLNPQSDASSSEPSDPKGAPDLLVEEQEAARAAGVSVGTLRRFVEVGALDSVEKEGGVFYAIPLIERLFAVSIPRLRTPLRPPPVSTSLFARTVVSAVETTADLEGEASPQGAFTDATLSSATISGQDKVMMFKQVLEAQDRLLVLKDEEIADLKKQRTWLQQRIEKLEQQSDRDRLILLSEAHTIKQLVAIEANRKSKLRAALEFFGIVPMREPIPAPPPLSWEVATTERLSGSMDPALPKAAVTDGRSAEQIQQDGRDG